jgi:hypothetical protein
MTGTVHIPAAAVDLLRDGLRSQMAQSARRIADGDGQLDRREHPERDQELLRRIDALRALLDDIGWSTPPSDLNIDLQTHTWALLEALRDQVSVHANMLCDMDRDGERRAAIARSAGTLQALALTVLLGIHARMMCMAAAPGGSGSE